MSAGDWPSIHRWPLVPIWWIFRQAIHTSLVNVNPSCLVNCPPTTKSKYMHPAFQIEFMNCFILAYYFLYGCSLLELQSQLLHSESTLLPARQSHSLWMHRDKNWGVACESPLWYLDHQRGTAMCQQQALQHAGKMEIRYDSIANHNVHYGACIMTFGDCKGYPRDDGCTTDLYSMDYTDESKPRAPYGDCHVVLPLIAKRDCSASILNSILAAKTLISNVGHR